MYNFERFKIQNGVLYGSQLLFRAAADRCGEAAACGGATATRNGGAAFAGLVVAARVVAVRMMSHIIGYTGFKVERTFNMTWSL